MDEHLNTPHNAHRLTSSTCNTAARTHIRMVRTISALDCYEMRQDGVITVGTTWLSQYLKTTMTRMNYYKILNLPVGNTCLILVAHCMNYIECISQYCFESMSISSSFYIRHFTGQRPGGGENELVALHKPT